MVRRGQLWCQLVEHVAAVAESCEENDGPSGAAPIEHLQLDVFLDGDATLLSDRKFNCWAVVLRLTDPLAFRLA